MTKSRTNPLSHATFIAERRIRTARAGQAQALRAQISASFDAVFGSFGRNRRNGSTPRD